MKRRDQDLYEYLENNYEKPDLKLKGVVSDNSQVSTAYYSTKMKHPSKHGKCPINEEDEETESGSPTASDFQASTTSDFQTLIIHSQPRILNKAFEIDMIALFDKFKFAKNKDKRKSYHATFDQKEKDRVKRKWKQRMHELQKHILFFDFVEKYYVSKTISKNSLNMVKK